MSNFDSVQSWLSEIRLLTEPECMSVLQGKSLSKDLQQCSTTLIKSGIDTVRNTSHSISDEFSKLFRYVENEKWKHVQSLTVQLTCHIRALIQECNRCIHQTPNYLMEQQEVVMGECAKLAQLVESTVSEKLQQKVQLVNQMTFLGQSFSRLVDMALGYLIQKLVEILDESHTPMTLTSCISTVISLGLEGEHMCFLLSREGCIRALFEICRTDTLTFAHVQSLRALATICCVAESILELEKEGGVDILAEILCDKHVSEAVRGEAAGVIAQITSPCLDNFHHIAGFLDNASDLLKALIHLFYHTQSHETFLLSAAAIANITFMDSQACEVLQQFDTPRLLIEASNLLKQPNFIVVQFESCCKRLNIYFTTLSHTRRSYCLQQQLPTSSLWIVKLVKFYNSLIHLDLFYHTQSHETFLLSAAAIANITFMDSQACEVLQQFDTPRLLIEASNLPKSNSLFVKDQIATVLANMATLESSREDIIRYKGISLLIDHLQQRPTQYKFEAEISACERVQQKAAIALTRICRDKNTAQVIADKGGIPRLVQLCRSVEERNNSDAVLVASLAALRKIFALCPSADMTTVDYHQLIKPKLMDSFVMCSNSDENFV